MKRDKVNIQGFGVDSFSFEDAISYVKEVHGQIVTINPEMIECANKNQEFANIIHEAELVVPDGVGVQIGLKILGHNVRRIPGVELGKALLKTMATEGKKVALVGAKPVVISKAVENLKNEINDLNIVYSHDGYFDDDKVIQDEVVNSAPDLVLVALGSPKQEFFSYELKKRLPNAIFIGLGGSFDVWAGVVDRAPKIYQKLGLEWLYRTVKEPQRFKRIFPTLPLFVLRVLKEKFMEK